MLPETFAQKSASGIQVSAGVRTSGQDLGVGPGTEGHTPARRDQAGCYHGRLEARTTSALCCVVSGCPIPSTSRSIGGESISRSGKRTMHPHCNGDGQHLPASQVLATGAPETYPKAQATPIPAQCCFSFPWSERDLRSRRPSCECRVRTSVAVPLPRKQQQALDLALLCREP